MVFFDGEDVVRAFPMLVDEGKGEQGPAKGRKACAYGRNNPDKISRFQILRGGSLNYNNFLGLAKIKTLGN